MSRTFRGGKRDANKALAQLVAEVDSIGTHADQAVAGLLLAHIDHLEQRGREARTIESYRGIARKVAADRLGGKMIQDLGPKDFDDFYVRLRSNGLSPGSIKRYHSVCTSQSGCASNGVARTAARSIALTTKEDR